MLRQKINHRPGSILGNMLLPKLLLLVAVVASMRILAAAHSDSSILKRGKLFLIYGTAWKKERVRYPAVPQETELTILYRTTIIFHHHPFIICYLQTAEYVAEAIKSGFRFIDTGKSLAEMAFSVTVLDCCFVSCFVHVTIQYRSPDFLLLLALMLLLLTIQC